MDGVAECRGVRMTVRHGCYTRRGPAAAPRDRDSALRVHPDPRASEILRSVRVIRDVYASVNDSTRYQWARLLNAALPDSSRRTDAPPKVRNYVSEMRTGAFRGRWLHRFFGHWTLGSLVFTSSLEIVYNYRLLEWSLDRRSINQYSIVIVTLILIYFFCITKYWVLHWNVKYS